MLASFVPCHEVTEMVNLQKRALLLRFAQAIMAATIFDGTVVAALPSSYPTRVVTIIVPFAAGTVTDTVARLMAEHLREALGQSFIVENKAGANGMIGAASVARAKADGYTLLFSTNTTQSAIKSLFKQVPYDPLTDFAPIARTVNLPSLVVVSDKLPVKTIQDFIAYAKANPGKLQYGYGNVSGQIAGEMLKRKTGIDMTAVPYRGNPQGLTDLIAGNIAIMIVDSGTGLPQVAAGTIRPLAMITPSRSALLPDLPTLNETVTPGFYLLAWGGLFAPTGTPPEIVTALAKACEKLEASAQFKQKLQKMGVETEWTGPEDLPSFLSSEAVRWETMVRDAGIEPQ
jgi:tripartite-type tricarboxylate transporter receptor subunit TctC